MDAIKNINNKTTAGTRPDKPQRRPRRIEHCLDDGYILAYCDEPGKGKAAALRKAGYKGSAANIRQEAYRIHMRLAGQINARIEQQMADGWQTGFKTALELCQRAESEAVQLSAAKTLMEYSGRKPADRLEVTDSRPVAEIDAEIVATRARIADMTGDEDQLH